MTKAEVVKIFKESVLPGIKESYEQDGVRDMPARQQAWNDFTDSLCKEGRVTLKQYETWTHPGICK